MEFRNDGANMKKKHLQILGVVLAITGFVGLYLGGFDFTEKKTIADNKIFSASFDREKHVDIPQWVSVSVFSVGVVFIVVGFMRKK